MGKNVLGSNVATVLNNADNYTVIASSLIPHIYTIIAATLFAYQNQPQAETIWPTAPRMRVDLTNVGQIRVSGQVDVVGNSTSYALLKYSADQSSWTLLTANYLPMGSAGPGTVTAWENIPAGAKADVYVVLFGTGGNGAADPRLTHFALHVR
jgi:hypothetical protein